MSSQFDDLEKRARALSREEKAALARVLIDEFDPVTEPGVQELWLEEARRRYDAYRKGEIQSLPGDEVMARARSRLQ
jgi:putative addiction module component (TIGR02574 family)